jgi:hypothetical protein
MLEVRKWRQIRQFMENTSHANKELCLRSQSTGLQEEQAQALRPVLLVCDLGKGFLTV